MNSIKTFFEGALSGMKLFGGIIVSVINFILLLPAYVIGIGIPSIIAKITGKKFLNLSKPNKKVESYWITKPKKKVDIDDAYNQY